MLVMVDHVREITLKKSPASMVNNMDSFSIYSTFVWVELSDWTLAN